MSSNYVTLDGSTISDMKALLFITLISLSLSAKAQTLIGAFTNQTGNITSQWLFKDGYCSHAVYKNNEYIGTKGGPFTYDGRTIVIHMEYNDLFPDSVGISLKIPVDLQEKKLILNQIIYKREQNIPQNLDGVWRITGRQTDKGLATIPRSDRKTIKILVDGCFQWIAINPAAKGFYGTGGGQYRFSDSKYTENILFFSRDNSRVGAQLNFKGVLKAEEWHHSGKSSKGDPIYEIWSKEK